MRIYFVIGCILLFPVILFAQGRKDIRTEGITKQTVIKYEYKTGKEVKTIDAEITYDARGNEIEIKEYDDYGKIIRHEKNTYNENNDKVAEADYDASGRVKKVVKYTYNEQKQKIAEAEYDGAGKLKKTMKYTWNGEFKTERLTFDAAGKLTQKKIYTYSR